MLCLVPEDAENAWASIEVLLCTEGDEEDRREALDAAKAMLEAEGFPPHLLEDHIALAILVADGVEIC